MNDNYLTRIIAVDDESYALENLTDAIAEVFPSKFIHAFSKPHEVLDYLKMHPMPSSNCRQFAFLDVELPGTSGIELARAIKSLVPNMIIIFVTGYNHYAFDAFQVHARGYLLKPVTADDILEQLEIIASEDGYPQEQPTPVLRIQTFGIFDAFIDDISIAFNRIKSKELLAYLVNCHGSGLTIKQIAEVLFPDQLTTQSIKKQTQNIILDLRKTLEEHHVEDVIVRRRNYVAIDPNLIDCDYYHFLEGRIDAINAYTGDYMTQYDWSYITNASLLQKNK